MNLSALHRTLMPATLLAGRLLLAIIFLHEGFFKLTHYAAAVAYSEAFGVPARLLPLAIAIELGCGILIAAGFGVRHAAALLAGFCLFTAFVFHTKFSDQNQLLHFEKNLAIAGGLLALAVCGPGTFSIAAWRSERQRRARATPAA
jgi:putative oxidoreductase